MLFDVRGKVLKRMRLSHSPRDTRLPRCEDAQATGRGLLQCIGLQLQLSSQPAANISGPMCE